MGARYLASAFSLGMLPARIGEWGLPLMVTECGLDDARDFVSHGSLFGRPWVSCVGHSNTAAVLSGLLGVEVPVRRDTIALAAGDVVLVAQYSGDRLPEGATALPEGASFRWLKVRVGGAT